MYILKFVICNYLNLIIIVILYMILFLKKIKKGMKLKGFNYEVIINWILVYFTYVNNILMLLVVNCTLIF